MSYIKKLLKLKNLSDMKFEGSVKLEGTGKFDLSLKLKWGENRKLYAGIRYGKGFENLGAVTSGENRYSIEGDCGDFAVVVGDQSGPVAACSTQNDLWSLYGYCDRLGERKEEHENKQETVSPPAAEADAEAQKKFDLREMGVTDVLILEDSTTGDDLEPYADVKEDYYAKAKSELREKNMKEYFSKIESLLQNNEREVRLEGVFPSSRFVRIDFDGNGKYYVVGAIYEDANLRYLCYGVPVQSKELPSRFVGVAQYVNAGDSGYLLLYQDAESGQMLTADSFI